MCTADVKRVLMRANFKVEELFGMVSNRAVTAAGSAYEGVAFVLGPRQGFPILRCERAPRTVQSHGPLEGVDSQCFHGKVITQLVSREAGGYEHRSGDQRQVGEHA